MTKIGTITPLRIEPPYTLRTKFTKAKYADESAACPGVKRIDSTTVEVEGNNLSELEF